MTARRRNQGWTCPTGSARRAPGLLGGARGFGGGGPSLLLGEPGVWLGTRPDELGTRGLLLGAPSSELGWCTSVGHERVLELGVCLKLLGSCPEKTGAPSFWGSGRPSSASPR